MKNRLVAALCGLLLSAGAIAGSTSETVGASWGEFGPNFRATRPEAVLVRWKFDSAAFLANHPVDGLPTGPSTFDARATYHAQVAGSFHLTVDVPFPSVILDTTNGTDSTRLYSSAEGSLLITDPDRLEFFVGDPAEPMPIEWNACPNEVSIAGPAWLWEFRFLTQPRASISFEFIDDLP